MAEGGTTMTREIDLRQTIIADPDNDDLRLVYADWCEDQGDLARSEFVRIQMQLATQTLPQADRERLENREQDLQMRWGKTWLEGWSEETTSADFRRGFVEHLACYSKDGVTYLLKHGARFFKRAPITSLWLCPQGGTFRLPNAWDFRREKADVDRLRPEHFLEVLELPFLTRLRVLDLGPSTFGGTMKIRGTVIGNLLGDDMVIRLARRSTLANLHTLDLSENNVGDLGGWALAESPHLKSLKTLRLGNSSLSDAVRLKLTARFPGVDFNPPSPLDTSAT